MWKKFILASMASLVMLISFALALDFYVGSSVSFYETPTIEVYNRTEAVNIPGFNLNYSWGNTSIAQVWRTDNITYVYPTTISITTGIFVYTNDYPPVYLGRINFTGMGSTQVTSIAGGCFDGVNHWLASTTADDIMLVNSTWGTNFNFSSLDLTVGDIWCNSTNIAAVGSSLNQLIFYNKTGAYQRNFSAAGGGTGSEGVLQGLDHFRDVWYTIGSSTRTAYMYTENGVIINNRLFFSDGFANSFISIRGDYIYTSAKSSAAGQTIVSYTGIDYIQNLTNNFTEIQVSSRGGATANSTSRIVVNKEKQLLMTTSNTGDALTIGSINDTGFNPRRYYQAIVSTGACSFDNIVQVVCNWNSTFGEDGMCIFVSEADANMCIVAMNVTDSTANFTFLGNYTSTAGSGSIQTPRMSELFEGPDNDTYGVACSNTDDNCMGFRINRTGWLIPLANWTAAANPCSLDGVQGTQLERQSDGSYLHFSGSSQDQVFSVLNFSSDMMNVSCVYNLTAGAGVMFMQSPFQIEIQSEKRLAYNLNPVSGISYFSVINYSNLSSVRYVYGQGYVWTPVCGFAGTPTNGSYNPDFGKHPRFKVVGDMLYQAYYGREETQPDGSLYSGGICVWNISASYLNYTQTFAVGNPASLKNIPLEAIYTNAGRTSLNSTMFTDLWVDEETGKVLTATDPINTAANNGLWYLQYGDLFATPNMIPLSFGVYE